MIGQFAAVGIGAALGAWLRWGLAVSMNALLPRFPLGTLVANLLGGFLVGMAMAYFLARNDLPPEWRLFVITGFLGGLTTFSAFSLEVTQLLFDGQILAAAGLAGTHLFGSLLLTIAGFASYRALAV
ncbi:MAG: fluoride efflux transporter CrcB [Betaproteobacteria bacterium]|nr:fluoride efflux transporter CrcB [Betaproteobacteria bacterium]